MNVCKIFFDFVQPGNYRWLLSEEKSKELVQGNHGEIQVHAENREQGDEIATC
jgi:hypothetical protein